jgi:DNA repair protein RecO (recombination protein O)
VAAVRGVQQTSDALVLRLVDYRDSDRIVTLFTRELGTVAALARGARGSKRRFGGALEPYAIVRVELGPARGELWSLESASVRQSFPRLLTDLARMEAAAGALLLLREAQAARQPDPALFLASVQYLALVDVAGDPERVGLLAFTLRALSLLGLAPRLDRCGRSAQPVPPGRAAYFDPALGSVVASRLGGGPFLLSGALRERLMSAQADAWLDVARARWDADALKLARAALAAFLAQHLKGELGARLCPA